MISMSRSTRSLGWVLLAGLCLAPVALAQDARNAPTHDDITDFFASVRADLYTCPHGWHGEVEAQLTVSRDGRVTTVEVEGEGLPPAVQSCVASVLRGGRMRAFSEPVAVIEYSFRL